jgi:hypothetical protein
LNHPARQAWIEIAHCLLIEINDTTGLLRPNIIYLHDGLRFVDLICQKQSGRLLGHIGRITQSIGLN